jgi:hypothetical protein
LTNRERVLNGIIWQKFQVLFKDNQHKKVHSRHNQNCQFQLFLSNRGHPQLHTTSRLEFQTNCLIGEEMWMFGDKELENYGQGNKFQMKNELLLNKKVYSYKQEMQKVFLN